MVDDNTSKKSVLYYLIFIHTACTEFDQWQREVAKKIVLRMHCQVNNCKLKK